MNVELDKDGFPLASCDAGCGRMATQKFKCTKCEGDLCQECFDDAHKDGVCIYY